MKPPSRSNLLFLLLHGAMSTINSMTIPPIVLLLLFACQYGRQPRARPQRVSSRRMYMPGRRSPQLVWLASSAAPVAVLAFAWHDVNHRLHDNTSDRLAFAFGLPILSSISCGSPEILFQTYVHVQSPFFSTCTACVVSSHCYCFCFCQNGISNHR
jgi:hypothetical protein